MGISATIALSVTGCDPLTQATGGKPLDGEVTVATEPLFGETERVEETLMGDVYIPPETDTEEPALAGVPMYPEETTEPEVVEPMGDMPV